MYIVLLISRSLLVSNVNIFKKIRMKMTALFLSALCKAVLLLPVN